MKKKTKSIITEAFNLANHVDAMRDDTYLVGHLGWLEIIKEADQLLKSIKDGESDLK